MNPPLSAMILCAGIGSRLRPLTGPIPKPLIPFCGVPLLSTILQQIKQIGVNRVGINTHYLPHKIEEFAQKYMNEFETRIAFEPSLLGSAGYMTNFRNFFKDQNVLLINGDICSKLPLEKFFNHHLKNKYAASVLVLKKHDLNIGGIFTKSGRIVDFSAKTLEPFDQVHNYACAQIYSPEFLDLFDQQGKYEIFEVYKRALSQGKLKIGYYILDNFWFDLGTHQDYLNAHTYYLKNYSQLINNGQDPLQLKKCMGGEQVFAIDTMLCNNREQGERIYKHATITHSYVDQSFALSQGSVVQDSVLLGHGKCLGKRIDKKLIFEDFEFSAQDI